MVGPVAGSFLYTNYGPRFVWGMEIGVISFTLLAWLVMYRRMVPLRVPTLLERRLSRAASLRAELINPKLAVGPPISASRTTPDRES